MLLYDKSNHIIIEFSTLYINFYIKCKNIINIENIKKQLKIKHS